MLPCQDFRNEFRDIGILARVCTQPCSLAPHALSRSLVESWPAVSFLEFTRAAPKVLAVLGLLWKVCVGCGRISERVSICARCVIFAPLFLGWLCQAADSDCLDAACFSLSGDRSFLSSCFAVTWRRHGGSFCSHGLGMRRAGHLRWASGHLISS